MNNYLKKYLSSFSFFYEYLSYRIFIAVGLSILVGILDGLGLTMFLPLLQVVDESSAVDPDKLGYLGILIVGVTKLGIPVSIVSILLLMILFFFLKGVILFIQEVYSVSVQQFFLKKLRVGGIERINNILYKSFVLSDVGRIQNTLTGEIERLAKAYQGYFRAVKAGVMVLVYMGFALLLNPQFAILVIIGGGLTNVLYRKIYLNTKQASRKLTVDTNFFQGQIIQYIGNFKYLKATGLLEKYGARLKKTVDNIESTNKRIGVLTGFFSASREPLMILVVSVVIYLQVAVLGGELGPLLVSLLFFYRALTFLMQMQSHWNFYISVAGSLENVTSFMLEMDEAAADNGTIKLDKFNHKIEIKDAFFSYTSQKILQGINLVINKNETIAFIGESGSGKTTLVNVIAGLLPLDKGYMAVDDQYASFLEIASYQNRIGYITQEPVIFSDTIFNNVTFWEEKSPATIKRFEAALKKAYIFDYVESLEMKGETQLGNNGINLSGGQKQRISIARELYKDIDILIMDEATSALDSETEEAIKQSIEALHGQYTIIIIAHRLSTVKRADSIVLIKNGEIDSIGNYDSLIARSSAFQKMVELQEL